MLNLLFAVIAAGASVLCSSSQADAAIVELSYELSTSGAQHFPTYTILNIEGTCTANCSVIPITMRISGTGPVYNSMTGSGWGGGVTATVSDNLGDSTAIQVSTGTYPGSGTNSSGGQLFPPTTPSQIFVSTSGGATALGGTAVIDYSIRISLPDGLRATAAVPEPATWAMIILGFAGVAFISRRRRTCHLRRPAESFACC